MPSLPTGLWKTNQLHIHSVIALERSPRGGAKDTALRKPDIETGESLHPQERAKKKHNGRKIKKPKWG